MSENTSNQCIIIVKIKYIVGDVYFVYHSDSTLAFNKKMSDSTMLHLYHTLIYGRRMFWGDETLFQSKADMLFMWITALSSANTFLIVYYANLQFSIWL